MKRFIVSALLLSMVTVFTIGAHFLKDFPVGL